MTASEKTSNKWRFTWLVMRLALKTKRSRKPQECYSMPLSMFALRDITGVAVEKDAHQTINERGL